MTATAPDVPGAGTATVDLLFAGYADTGVTPYRVASSVSLLRDGDATVIVDPGFVPDRRALLERLADLGLPPEDVTDVVISHHHPDHTANVALFPQARLHDFWAVYRDDTWLARPAEGVELAASIRLLETPGHTPQDITTVARTESDVVAFTHLWWSAEGPAEDPFASDPAAISAGRARVLEVATLVVPGHGPAFRPGPDTPR